jgi:glycosyltransferase involved in cell wall biosynthesis
MDIVTAPYAPMGNDPIYFSPLKVFEYMAMGKPVVASRIDQLAEIFEDGEEIVLIKPGNVEELADAILKLIADSELAQRLGANARTKVLSTYTWGKTVVKILEIYSDLKSNPT